MICSSKRICNEWLKEIGGKRPKRLDLNGCRDAKEKVTDAGNMKKNKAGYTATEVGCGWAEALFEVTRPFGQEQ